MINIVGSILLLCSTLSLVGQIRIDITSMDGAPIKQASVGQPFVIKVSDTNSNGSIVQPKIEGIEQFVSQGNSFAMHSINGESTVVYKFNVRADIQGTYTVGPVHINQGTTPDFAEPFEIVVGTHLVSDKKQKSHTQMQVELKADKQEVVVGEKIHCTLTIYSPGHIESKIQNIEQPEDITDTYTIANQGKPQQGKIKKDGITYLYGIWEWDMYPKKSGSLLLPAWSVDYARMNQGGLGFFKFMGFWETKRAYSNALPFKVKPLPPCDKKVDAIGTFEAFEACLDATVVTSGSAQLLWLTLRGDANWDCFDAPVLQGLPSSLRSYYSKSDLTSVSDTQAEKKFEYVIQSLEVGDWEIPPQEFTYFDIKVHRYKTLKTHTLYVTINPSKVTALIDELISENPVRQDIYPIQTMWETQMQETNRWWYITVIILLIQLCLILYVVSHTLYKWMYTKYYHLLVKRYAFRKAKKAISYATQTRNYALLYTIFVDLFTERASIEKKRLNLPIIDAMLLHLDETQRLKWDLFFKDLKKIHFSYGLTDEPMLFIQARQWVARFEKERIVYVPDTKSFISYSSH